MGDKQRLSCLGQGAAQVDLITGRPGQGSDAGPQPPGQLAAPVLRPVPGLDVAASDQPAAGGATVVGDFYDLFHVRGPWWSTVVGDVCGKGVEAAKLTALARYTLRADAVQHMWPAPVLTAAYATFRVTTGGMAGRLCCAGHPPPLVRRADGRVRWIDARGALLG